MLFVPLHFRFLKISPFSHSFVLISPFGLSNVYPNPVSQLRFIFIFIIIIFLFVVNFVIHWNEKALGSHVFPILIPPPTSLPTRSLQFTAVEEYASGIIPWVSPVLIWMSFRLDFGL